MEKKIKVLISLGTRPEGIKMAPVIKELQKSPQKFDPINAIFNAFPPFTIFIIFKFYT